MRNSNASMVLNIMEPPNTLLHDIKEEEDIEITQLNTDDHSSTSKELVIHSNNSSQSLQSSANDENISISHSNTDTDTDISNNLNMNLNMNLNLNLDLDLDINENTNTNSKDELSLLPPLPKSIEPVLTATNHDIEHTLERENIEINNINNTDDLKIEIPTIDNNININSSVQTAKSILIPSPINDNSTTTTTTTSTSATTNNNINTNNINDKINDTPSTSNLMDNDIAETSFDLSKALKIPVTDSTNTTTSFEQQISNGPLSPIMSSPKISLKKKLSNVILNNDIPFTTNNNSLQLDSSQFHITKNSSSVRTLSNSINGKVSRSNSHSNSIINQKLDGGSSSSASSFNNNNNSSGSNGNMNSNIKLSQDFVHESHSFIKERIPLRKVSTGSTSSNSNSTSTSRNDEQIFKVPPSLLRQSTESRSRSSSNGNINLSLRTTPLALDGIGIQLGSTPIIPNSITAGINTPTVLSNNNELPLSNKKLPLLRRASSAILRKTSMKNIAGTDLQNNADSMDFNPLRVSTTIDIDNRLTTYNSNVTHSVTQINSNTQENNQNSLSRQPSIGSRVKKGFSRIISGNNTNKRVASNSNDVSRVNSNSNSNSIASDLSNDRIESPIPTRIKSSDAYLEDRILNSGKGITPLLSRRVSSAGNKGYSANNSNESSNRKFVTSNNVTSGTVRRRSSQLARSASAKNNDVTRSSSRQSNTLEKNLPNFTKFDEISVNLEKLTKTVPVISVTDDYNSQDLEDIKIQSNINLDEVYEDPEKKHPSDVSSPVKNVSLKEYINILIEQQKSEDKRLASLEKNFTDSGWCSASDLRLLRQKRIITNRRWDERIAFYKSKLDT
ncbi:hypothetical protein Kpol_1018p173 [Vanderwaltozyma polyspora DSM 70294]|uniref:Uncharacterized protein n=1 Tax=Vanderwaltozyma polyspora (strain ATCC 22028 / DSM 70294 / BCRC 21397 / CBS 2163 / NBRC 10782 / NRRL Y-8283 / UCD 57-17) TaxID=436907 RepID=A7TE13_VANPO|nr:uncharacterized protein Kpol_1018p173 [Vanderwaltozyma polyspora DSM 70294]EDO19633.1 hypothetical protein Kpol_1018p173 [Vanderwaltozyma polyspora DSM 70294]